MDLRTSVELGSEEETKQAEAASSVVATREEGLVLTRCVTLWRRLSFNDRLTGAYLLGLVFALLIAPPHPARGKNLAIYSSFLLGYVAIVVGVRSGLLRPAWLGAFSYRTAQIGALLGSYLLFRDFLPVVNPGTLDLELYRLDLMLFGGEPALWLDQRLSPFATEWFSFFYYSYFLLLAAHLFPIVYLSRRQELLAQFGLGMTVAAAVGQTLYMLVPGFGPFKALADQFQNELPSGFWWNTVLTAVNAGGAQKDIFPSMHTCFPSFVAMFSFCHRKSWPFRFTWPLVTFFVVNIIGATLYLRWHYVIDVVFGLALASVATFFAVRVAPRELAYRQAAGLPRIWPAWKPEGGSAERKDFQRA